MTTGTLTPFETDILDDLLGAQRRLGATPIDLAQGHRSGRRVIATITVAAALGTAAVVVATDLATTTPNQRHAVTNHSTEPIRAQTVAFITRRAAAALATVDDMLLHTRETRIRTTPSGVVTETYDTWSDRGNPEHSRSMYTRDGQPIYDIQTDSTASSEILVDYPTRTWYRSPTIDYSNQHLIGSTPDNVRERLDSGGLTLVGHETINGHDVLHLTRTDTGPLAGDLWVDATTYLVVRTTNPIGTTDYDWLDRNATTRSLLVPVVPTGFTFGGHARTTANADGSHG
jgi:hypothetical protein